MRLIAPLVTFDRTPRARGDGFIHFGSSHNQGHAHGRRVYHSFDRITDLCAAGRAAGGQRGAACSKSASSRSFLSLPPPLGFLITAIRIIDNEMFFLFEDRGRGPSMPHCRHKTCACRRSIDH